MYRSHSSSRPSSRAVSGTGAQLLARPEEKRQGILGFTECQFPVGGRREPGADRRQRVGKKHRLEADLSNHRADQRRRQVVGRVAALLALGAGFHPDLSGRENVYLNGSILGLRRAAIRRLFDSIVSFAELERFIDTPVRNYSSGMQMRLGFSIATAFRPDILLIDEVLAVGDQGFQDRCLRRIIEYPGGGSDDSPGVA